MPKPTTDECSLIARLHAQGDTHREIADRLNWTNKTAIRSVARIIKQMREEGSLQETTDVVLREVEAEEVKTLDEMTREQRVTFLRSKINNTPRFKLVFRAFDPEEQSVFIDEYMNIITSIDSLTEAEEQTLFASVGEYILAYRALNFKTQEERWYQGTMDGSITSEDDEGNPNPRYRRINDSEKYQKQYDSHMKLYQKGYSELKMSRVQRMKEVRSDRKSLIDVIEQFSSKNAQADASEQILKLQKMRDSQLIKMIEDGSIYGIFDD